MLSLTDHELWRRRISAAAARYRVAKMRAAEVIVDRLSMAEPDGSFARSQAAQEELRALQEYSGLLIEYSRAQTSEPEES